jgi:hypothetical protein
MLHPLGFVTNVAALPERRTEHTRRISPSRSRSWVRARAERVAYERPREQDDERDQERVLVPASVTLCATGNTRKIPKQTVASLLFHIQPERPRTVGGLCIARPTPPTPFL